MKIKLLLGLVLTFIAAGCSEERPYADTFNLDVAVEIAVINEKGEDLLNPETSEAIDPENIRLYYVLDGKPQEVDKEDGDAEQAFLIFNSGGKYRMRILQNHLDTDGKPLTLVQWDRTDIDTIKSEFLKGDRYLIQDKIYFNDKLSWSTGDSYQPYFEVVKKN